MPVIYIFTCSLRCMHKHFLVFSGFNLRTPLLRCFQVTEHAVLFSSAHWLAGLKRSEGATEKNVFFLTAGPNVCTHTPSLDELSKRKYGSDGSLFPFKGKILVDEANISRKQISSQGTVEADCCLVLPKGLSCISGSQDIHLIAIQCTKCSAKEQDCN